VSFFRVTPLLLHSVSGHDLRRAFTNEIWGYRCTTCAQVFLKPGAGLKDWRKTAAGILSGPVFHAVNSLPVVQCKQMAGTDGLGVPLGVCDRCYCRVKRKRLSGAGQEASEGGIPTTPLNRPPPPLSTAPGTPEDPRLCHAPVQTDVTTASACPDCRFLRERISNLERAVDRATQWATLAKSKAADLRVRLLTALLPHAPSRVQPPTCGDSLVAWRDGALGNDRDGPELQAIAATILLRSTPPDNRLRHANGQEVVYARQVTARKPVVGRSQGYRRLAHGIRLLSGAVGGNASAAVAAGSFNITVAAPSCRRGRGSGALVPISATPEQQLWSIARHGVSLSAFFRSPDGSGWLPI